MTRTVLTTGANSGLGLATVIEMAQQGYQSVGTVRSAAKAKVVQGVAEEEGVDVETVILDVTDAKKCTAMIDDIRPDVLINNAGYMVYGAVEEIDDETARDLFETLVIAPTRLARLAIPHMRRRKWGRIIQVSSLSARVSFPLMGWYQGAKQALEGISDALRVEVASSGISVVLIEPGIFRSEMSDEFTAPDTGGESRYGDAYARSNDVYGALDRFMTEPQTVAGVIADAIKASIPKARYPVGVDARMNILSDPLMPTMLRDRAMRAMFKL